MADDLTTRITAFLDEHVVMSLATAGPNGLHATNLFYARDHLALVWLSDPDTRHSRDLETQPDVAATVAADSADFRTIRGVQMHGLASRVGEAMERVRLLALLGMRYRFLASIKDAPQAIQAAYQKAQVYRLSPRDIVLIDNTKGFGHKETLTL